MVSFDPVAGPYRWLEYLSFGPWLTRCRTAQIAQLANLRHALVLGDGDGRFLARLLAAHPHMTADVVDSSEAMLRLLDQRISQSGAQGRVCLHHADVLEWQPHGEYDLVVSHFFLDCFFPEQVEQLLDHILPQLAPEAQWVISEFAIPSGKLTAPAGRMVVSLLYRAFGWLTGLRVRTLPDYAGSLHRRGWVVMREQPFLWGLLCSQIWSRSQKINQKMN
jgi:ubiquinone/menaquinone biosynthesis C-methylase UbiE